VICELMRSGHASEATRNVALTCGTACQRLALSQLNGRSDSHLSGARGAMYVEPVGVADGRACVTNRSKCTYDAISIQIVKNVTLHGPPCLWPLAEDVGSASPSAARPIRLSRVEYERFR
jgi:hypothetical protein